MYFPILSFGKLGDCENDTGNNVADESLI